jgi:hypothetical protein
VPRRAACGNAIVRPAPGCDDRRDSDVAVALVGSGEVATIALEECDRRAACLVPQKRAGLSERPLTPMRNWRLAGAWQRAGRVSLSFARVVASLADGGGGSDLAPSPGVDGLDVQAGPVDELLDVSVERPAVDQLEVKVGRTLEDRFLSALTGDHWEERHLDSVD